MAVVTESPAGAPVRLLVVEDDEGIGAPLVAGLAREGFEVRHVTTGGAALSADLPDAVLLDLRLPDMDGFDVCRALRARSATLPILILYLVAQRYFLAGMTAGSGKSWRGRAGAPLE